MNKLKILKLMIQEKKHRWRYLYLTFYALGCRNLPLALSKRISKSNKSELERKGLLPVILDTYDGSGQVVHPDVMYIGGKLWMVCTPYPYSIESYENPCIYSGETIYDMKPISNNPLSYQEFRKKGNHISDPCMFFDGDRLYTLFRDTINIGGNITQKLYLSSSTDGRVWEEKKLLFESNKKSYISPAVLKYNNRLIMFYIQLGESTNGGDIHKVELNNNYNEVKDDIVKCYNLPENMVVWHIGLTFDESNAKQYIENEGNSSGITGVFVLRDKKDVHKYALYWAHANNIDCDWYIQDEIVIPRYISENMVNMYKSAIIPSTGELLLSYNDKDYRWNLAVLPGKKSEDNDNFEASYKIFSRVFRKRMTYKRFLYKHKSNPTLLNNYYVQKKDDNMVIGTNCFNGATGIINGGVEFKLAQSCDTAVVPEARGKGVFSNMISEAELKLYEEGVEVMLGFPNNNSFHGFIKLGWKHIGNFTPWVKIMKPIDVLSNKMFNTSKEYAETILPLIQEETRRFKITEIKLFDKCPFSEDDINIINSEKIIKIKRSIAYYTWKCDLNEQFYYYVIRGKNSFAYFIFRVTEKGRIIVVDYFFNNKVIDFERICFKQFVFDVRNMGNTVVFPMVHEMSEEEQLLRNLGFLRGDKKIFGFPVARMIIHSFNEDKLSGIENFANWYISSLDVDTIIS